MARNAIESVVQLTNRQLVVLDGTLIGQTKSTVTFKYRPRGKRVVVQKVFARKDCRQVGPNQLVVELLTKLGRPVKGIVETKDDGVYVDGVWFDPNYVEVVAEIGIEDAAPKGDAKAKKKKAAK